ncbi:MAG TPA: DUF4038 domain-containing protein [Prolixibacteraceae bacterium]|nr:DUF4038 domain-containing protein [Prolixibacteraceae bacterium]
MKYLVLVIILVYFGQTVNGQSIFPLKISENKRFFVTQQEIPFLYTADTGWKIFTNLTTAEAVEFMKFRKAQGFNTIQTMIVMTPEDINRYGQKPFLGDVDFSRPNEAYHDHVYEIIAKADSLGLLIVMSQPWLGCCGEGFGTMPEKPIQKNGITKNRIYGQYLGKKFAGLKNLLWIIGGDNDPKGDREFLLSFAEGLYESAPKHQFITYHASSTHSSTDLFQYAPWLGFSFIYTYWREKPNSWAVHDLVPHVYEVALREWTKSDIMPFVLGESQYEGTGSIDNDMGNPQIIRRQAYWTVLCGGAGSAYGSDLWNFPPTWREIIQYKGANQMGYMRKFFEQIPWWTLEPDFSHSCVVSGFGEWSTNNYVTTAVSHDKKLMVSYLPEIQSLSVDFGFLSGDIFKCTWFNPRTGETDKVFTIKTKSVQRISPVNGEDWVLMVQGSN